MNIFKIFDIARQSIGMCIVLDLVILLLYLFGYVGLYRHCMLGEKRLSLRHILFLLVYCNYLMVVLYATLFYREVHSGYLVKLGLLSTYRKAWNSFLIKDYGLFILNIAMFIPIGLFSPIVIEKCKKSYVTYLLGLLLTIIIESEQYITRRGLFEVPDIVHNEVGCMIGYGVWSIGTTIRQCRKNEHKKISARRLLCYQLPLLFVIGLYGSIFVCYHCKELGNLPTAYIKKMNMSHITLNSNILFAKQKNKTMVYKGKIGHKKDTIQVANELFHVHNTAIDEAETKSFDIVDIYTSKDGKYMCYVYYDGVRTWFIDMTSDINKARESSYSLDVIRNLLKPYQIEIPASSKMAIRDDGQFEVQVSLTKSGNDYIEGDLYGCMNQEKKLIMFHNNLLHLKEYKKFQILSQQDAYKAIQKGYFKLDTKKDYHNITITAVKLIRQLDTKGYYQPVYDFSIYTEHEEGHIYIGALQKSSH